MNGYRMGYWASFTGTGTIGLKSPYRADCKEVGVYILKATHPCSWQPYVHQEKAHDVYAPEVDTAYIGRSLSNETVPLHKLDDFSSFIWALPGSKKYNLGSRAWVPSSLTYSPLCALVPQDSNPVHLCVYVCMCVCEKEGGREEPDSLEKSLNIWIQLFFQKKPDLLLDLSITQNISCFA